MSETPKFVEKFNATFRDRLHAVIDELNLDVDRDPFTKLLANCIASKEYADEVKRELAAERARADRAKAEGIKEGMRLAAKLCGDADKSTHPADLADAILKEIGA